MRARVVLAALALAATLVVRRDAVADDAPPAAASPEIAAAVRALTRDRIFKDAQIGIVVMDCETGAILAESGSHTVLNPASNAKLYTAAAALAILHGAYRYQTTLSGTIHGNSASTLVLRGHGDPSLRQQDLWAMVQELKMHGVKKVDGDLVVDQSFFDEQTTPPAFEQQPNEWAAFRAPVSALALDENTVTLLVRPTTSGQPAHVAFSPPGFVDVEGSIKTGDDGADTVGLELTGADHRLHAKISGTVGGDSKLVRYTKRVDDPQLLAGYALRAILDAADVKVSGDVKLGTSGAKGTTITHHESEPLSTLLYALGKNSDNFYAEMIFKSLAGEAKRPAKSQDAADIVTKWIEKNDIGDQGIVIKNGSGLFDSNRVTAFSVAKLLKWTWQEPTLRNEYVAQLAIGGVDGTLHKRFRDTRAHRAVRAKTGTLDDAIALSGYVLAPNGKHSIAYSILFNKVSGHAASARAAADKLVEIIHDRYYP
ncbi:MAG TPA: D-alanyl-D-alanine carboxypeptidase/D-alanyl-D-alanine-endopeptidase [Labilithrix sp.]|jgi:D-alanyl-D-alanine carboxypeptidase/D-alanyl-D-alanine-endopeptidase (penicillin-binding protein 4)